MGEEQKQFNRNIEHHNHGSFLDKRRQRPEDPRGEVEINSSEVLTRKHAKPSTQSQGQEAVTRPNTDMMDKNNPGTTGTVATNAKLEPGANSFTEAQARSRMEQAGFKDVKDLKKDDQGIWRGQAMRDGKPVTVGFDFKGNMAAQ